MCVCLKTNRGNYAFTKYITTQDLMSKCALLTLLVMVLVQTNESARFVRGSFKSITEMYYRSQKNYCDTMRGGG